MSLGDLKSPNYLSTTGAVHSSLSISASSIKFLKALICHKLKQLCRGCALVPYSTLPVQLQPSLLQLQQCRNFRIYLDHKVYHCCVIKIKPHVKVNTRLTLVEIPARILRNVLAFDRGSLNSEVRGLLSNCDSYMRV